VAGGGTALERPGHRARQPRCAIVEAVTRAFDGESVRRRAMALT
jgi:hypothetical protein